MGSRINLSPGAIDKIRETLTKSQDPVTPHFIYTELIRLNLFNSTEPTLIARIRDTLGYEWKKADKTWVKTGSEEEIHDSLPQTHRPDSENLLNTTDTQPTSQSINLQLVSTPEITEADGITKIIEELQCINGNIEALLNRQERLERNIQKVTSFINDIKRSTPALYMKQQESELSNASSIQP